MGGVPQIEGYDIVRELGRGAMGVVYLARDRFLERDVAIKVIADPELTTDAVERFLREARAMARLSHPNVVAVFRAGVAEGAPFLAMELLRGRSLDAALENEGPLDATLLFSVALDTARSLAAAHARGVVHRDIKPSNLFHTEEGAIKVLDFGVAKLTHDVEARTDPTAPPSMRAPATVSDSVREMALDDTVASSPDAVGAIGLAPTSAGSKPDLEGTLVTGTACFMAPEVWRAEGADGASDVWSLGATLFTLATGRPPFVGRNLAEVAFQVMTSTPAETIARQRTDVPAELADAIDRCLAKDRAKRFTSAAELVVTLERIARAERAGRAAHTDAPYPGLRPMDAQDRERFFGRDDDVARVLERLRSEALVVLVGASGAGKSSLAAAGIAPRVVEGALGEYATWRVVRVVPGRSPIGALASALSSNLGIAAATLARDLIEQPDALARALREAVVRDGEGVLLLVDQLEELVTMSAGEERDALAVSLAGVVDVRPRGVRILATARSDLFDRLGALGELGARLGRATELVRPLAGAALRAAIVEPARAVGHTFEDESQIDEILGEVGDGAGVLPLVAFAVRQWWERRDRERRVLTRAGWESLGGVLGALGAHADAVHEGLSAEDRDAARAVFTRLVAGDGTRRYATRTELDACASGSLESMGRALEAYANARLLQCEGDVASGTWTISHEALARAWGRLRGWLEAGREDRAFHEQLTGAVRAWEAARRRPDLLWRASLLRELGRWRELYDDTLSPSERAFADVSVARERRQRRGSTLVVGAVVLALGGVAARYGLRESRANARELRTRAELSRLTGTSRVEVVERAFATAHALRENDPSTALAWLVSAAHANGRATPSMRAMALGLADRGASVRVPCTSNVALRDDGSFAVCAAGDTVYMVDLVFGSIHRVAALEQVRSLSLASDANVVYWLDASRRLVRWDEDHGRTVVASGVAPESVVASDPSGERAVVLDIAADKLWLSDADTGRRELQPVLEGLIPGGATGHWSARVEPGNVAWIVLERAGTSALRRIPLGAGPDRAGEAVTCRAYEFSGDALLCHDGVLARAMSLASGVERAVTEAETQRLAAKIGSAGSAVTLAAVGDRALMVDAAGRVDLRGGFPFAGPLGVRGVAVTAGVIEPRGHRVALVDVSNTLHMYSAAGLEIHATSWLDRGVDDAARARSERLGRVAALAVPGGRAAVAAPGLGMSVVDVAAGRAVFAQSEVSTVAVAAEGAFVLLGLADGTGVRIDLAEQRILRGALLAGAEPVAVAVSYDGAGVAAIGAQGDPAWRRVAGDNWTSISFTPFSELHGARSLAAYAGRLAVAGRLLGVVQAQGLTTFARAPAAFQFARIGRMRFVGASNIVVSDDGGTLWYTRCDDERCDTEWLGEGYDAVPIERDASLALQRDGSVRLFERGRHAPADVLLPGRLAALRGVAGSSLALGVDESSVVVAGPATRPAVVSIALPPDDVEAFGRWVARRTNVEVAGGGVVQLGEVPGALP